MFQAGDAWYFCRIGRFDVARANFEALLDADPDAVALLEFADRVKDRRDVLLQLVDNPTVGPYARRMLEALEEGEALIKADPARVRENIQRLAGPPRGFENALEALKESGEYAIPFMVQTLLSEQQRNLLQPLLRALPQIDRPALNPLVMALRMDDPVVKVYLIDALGQIGYAQAVPYLLALVEDDAAGDRVSSAARDALDALQRRGVQIDAATAGEAFYHLAEGYYEDLASLAADKRLDEANVWYWRDGILENIKVPTAIFNEVMCMRCCEEALRLDPEMKPALGLWIAANFRRVAQLPEAAVDRTRPDDYPPPAYFAQSAGPQYCLMALARAIDDNDPAVALGAIAALRKTAGPASLVAGADGRLPLAEALSFPDRMVRIRAGLTLARGLPTEPFRNHQNLMPVLSEALRLHAGARNALIVDPDDASANSLAATLRDEGYSVVVNSSFYAGLTEVREGLPGVDVIFIASDIGDPGLEAGLRELRGEFRFAATPVVLIAKPGDVEQVNALVRNEYSMGQVPVDPSRSEVVETIDEVMRSVGAAAITPEVGAELAREATVVLRLLAVTHNPLFDVAAVEPALEVTLMGTDEDDLRIAVADVLSYVCAAAAQNAIGGVALDPGATEALRVAMFAALSDAAKHCGSLLDPDMLADLVRMAESDPNMTIREAASQALGALNVPGEPASEIIRNQYQG
jgi:tetratricopeptide (TPR) repeat protein